MADGPSFEQTGSGSSVMITLKIKKKLNIYNIPNSNMDHSKAIGTINKDAIVYCNAKSNGWYKMYKPKTGWIYGGPNGADVKEVLSENWHGDTPTKPVTNESNVEASKNTKNEPDQRKTEKFSTTIDYDASQLSKMVIKDCRGIHGMPYQFMDIADRRLIVSKNGAEGHFGRKYAERIVTRMPLLLLTPGEPNYLTGFSKESKKNILSYLGNAIKGFTPDETLENMINGDDDSGRYFTLDFAYNSYYKYVNSMLRQAALFLNIHGVRIPEKGNKPVQLGNYDWSYATNSHLPGVVSSEEYVAFYIDSENSINESFDNSTTDSILANTMSSGSNKANELKFLMGSYGIDDALLDNDMIDQLTSSFQSFIDATPLTNNRLVQRLMSDVKTVVTGGKVIFPEIWSDSSFSRSYSIDIKLRTPDCDKLSWYLNIFVPLAHLICLTAPRQVVANGKSNPNAYSAPFLVRGFYKGIMSVEMGIISSMSITKGAESAWTVDGLPTQVDVNIQLKDLYDGMMINQYIGRTSWNLMKNNSMTDYIATSCGININKPDIRRNIDFYIMQKYNKVGDIPRHLWLGVQEAFASSLYQFLREGKITF